MASSFGKTWWGEQWLNSLSNIDYSNRLPRGASYANKGAVEKIKIEGNHISARVKGSRRQPYKVDIIMPPFFDPELGSFIREITNRPVIISKLLNRELDPEIMKLAERFGLKVFPQQWSDLKMQCSCPDWAVPCKHLASVIYKVSAEIDNNPFLAFTLHNVDLPGELDKLGVVIKRENAEIPKLKSLFFGESTKKDHDPEKAYRKLSFAGLSPLHEVLTSLLTPYPPFYVTSASDFREKYLTHLNRVVKVTRRAALGKIPLPEFFAENFEGESRIGYHSENRIIIDDNLRARISLNDETFSIREFLQQLAMIRGSKTPDYQPSTAALHTTLHLAMQLAANGAIVPQIVQLPGKDYFVRWLPAMLSKKVKKLVDELDDMLPPDVFVWEETKRQRNVTRDRALNLLSLFISEIVDLVSKRVESDLFEVLFFRQAGYPFIQPGEEALAGGIMTWLQKFYLTQGKFKPVIIVEEQKNETFRLTIDVQFPDHNRDISVPLKDLLTRDDYNHDRYEVLQSLAQLSGFINGLDRYINSLGEKDMIMGISEFGPFLMQMVPAIQLMDISVLLPKSLKNILKPCASVKLKTKSNGKSYFRLDKLLDFEWQVAVGDTLMDEQEFKNLLQKSEGLIRFKSAYIYVDQAELEKLSRHFSQSRELSAFQMLRAALSGDYYGAKVALTDEVRQLIDAITNISDVPIPEGLMAQLRPYQQRGYAWICRNSQIGFGSVLADDMGLGKTLQVIASVLKFKAEGLLEKEKVLVVAPTGLITNWEAEVSKFAPSLKTAIYHGANRDLEKLDGFDILLTSYGIARSDAKILGKKKWHAVVIDEAQNIKNQNTGQTKAIKSISASNFIALSGTPVENRLSELWSIMDYSNRGILGSLKDFSENYGNPIEQLNDQEVASRLKKVTAPFMMRRLKSDKSIIADLPEKVEIDSYARLTPQQAGLV